MRGTENFHRHPSVGVYKPTAPWDPVTGNCQLHWALKTGVV
jgi:hypothetical protein